MFYFQGSTYFVPKTISPPGNDTCSPSRDITLFGPRHILFRVQICLNFAWIFSFLDLIFLWCLLSLFFLFFSPPFYIFIFHIFLFFPPHCTRWYSLPPPSPGGHFPKYNPPFSLILEVTLYSWYFLLRICIPLCERILIHIEMFAAWSRFSYFFHWGTITLSSIPL